MLAMKAKSGLWFLSLIVKITCKADSSNVFKIHSKLFNKSAIILTKTRWKAKSSLCKKHLDRCFKNIGIDMKLLFVCI